MPSLLMGPGSAVRLKQQPSHVPDFLVADWKSDRVWIRQPDWPDNAQLCIRITQLAIPASAS